MRRGHYRSISKDWTSIDELDMTLEAIAKLNNSF